MKSIGLSFYSFTIVKEVLDKKGKKKEECVSLNNIGGIKVTECVYNYLKNKATSYEDDSIKEKISKPENADIVQAKIGNNPYFSSMHSIIKSGEYGVEIELINAETGKKTHTQNKKEAGVLPFGFALYISNVSSKGILVTQTFGTSGLLTHIKNILELAIKQRISNAYLVVKSVLPHQYFQQLMDKRSITALVVETKKKSNEDLSDKDSEDFSISYKSTEKIYKAPIISDKVKKKLSKVFRDREALSELSFLVGNDEKIENIKIVFKVGNKLKHVNYNTFFNLQISQDISNLVTRNPETEHPIQESLYQFMDDAVQTYLIAMDIIVAPQGNDTITYDLLKHFYLRENNDRFEVIEQNGTIQ